MADTMHLLLDLDERARRRAVRGLSEGPGLYALRTVLVADPSARVRAAAARRLGALGGAEPRRWLAFALRDALPLVRVAAVQGLGRAGEAADGEALGEVLRGDPCWWVRRAAALALVAVGDEGAVDRLRACLDDPVWRVRLGVVQALVLLASSSAGARARAVAPLPGASLPAALALDHLRALLDGAVPTHRTLAAPAASPGSDLIDDDPAVTTARQGRLAPGSVAPSRLVGLLADPHLPLRREAVRHLSVCADEPSLRQALGWLDDPRAPYAAQALARLCEGVGALADQVAQRVVEEGASPAVERWARQRLRLELPRAPDPSSLAGPGPDDPWARLDALDLASAPAAAVGDPDPWVRRRAASLAVRGLREPGARRSLGEALASAPDPVLRVQAALLLGADEPSLPAALALYGDPDPAVRSAAADLLAGHPPEAVEAALASGALGAGARRAALTWLVARCQRAASLALAGEGEQGHAALLRAAFVDPPAAGPAAAPGPAARWRPGEGAARAALGATGLALPRLVLSGRHEPPARALREAYEQGAEAFFWEPNYLSLTRFLRDPRLPRDRRAVVTGTYHADAASIERDVDRALRRLRADALDVFLLFWARSPGRIDAEAHEAMLRLKHRGKVRAVGFSTHLRALALDAMARGGWDVIMTRHSAAHRGAEARLLPEAAARGVSVITFTNLCYGRLLAPVPGSATEPARAVDCYRYSLSTPGVTLSLSAPRTQAEVREALGALASPGLDEASRARLLAHGEAVYALSQHVNGLLRQAPTPTRPGVRSLALDGLAAPQPPEAPLESPPPALPLALRSHGPSPHER